MSNTNDEFWNALTHGDLVTVRQFLTCDKSLAGRNFRPESLHTDGFPLYHAAMRGDLEIVRLLLEHGADPDAKLETDEPRETGMPLVNALEHGHFDVIHLLLGQNPSLNACGYCCTPFVDCLFNSMFDRPEHADELTRLFRSSYQSYLGKANGQQPAAKEPVQRAESFMQGGDRDAQDQSTKEQMALLRKVVAMGGVPSLFTVVRHQQHDLIQALLRHCPSVPGTVTDWPRGSVFDNICYGASWTGYPKTLDDCRAICPELFTSDVAKKCIENAISSHNRDGSIDDYGRLIKSQLEYLRREHAMTESYSSGDPFLPLHLLACDFIEPANYGFRCPTLSTPDDLIRLAQLFIEYGQEVNTRHPATGLTPLRAAVQKDQRKYAELLRQNGAID